MAKKSSKTKEKTKKETEKKAKSVMKKTISIEMDIDLVNQLDKRARKNFMSLRELMNDILRRSMTTYNKGSRSSYSGPPVERFVGIFSRKKRGRKPKK